ncbi:MAG: hypothetical protein ABI871_05335 [Chthoniobacterales bacterium]
MNELNENDIGRLLRLKRYEQPPGDYFENFLHEFHRRQRDELLRQPLWRICWQRAHDFMFSVNVPALTSYPVAFAAVLVCAAVLSLKVYETPAPATNVALQESASLAGPTATRAAWSLSSPVTTRDFGPRLARNVRESARTHRAATPPRYVLDAVPVSYEPTLTF